jgi:hypothetical protein
VESRVLTRVLARGAGATGDAGVATRLDLTPEATGEAPGPTWRLAI